MKRVHFTLRTLILVITFLGVILGLWRLDRGEVLVLALVTATFIVSSFVSKDGMRRRLARSYASAMSVVCLVCVEFLSVMYVYVAGFRIPGPPHLVLDLLLLVGAIVLIVVGVSHTFHVLRNGTWLQRALCSPPAIFFAALISLVGVVPFSQNGRAYATTALFLLRGHEGKAIYIGRFGRSEVFYRNGLREGVWREWDTTGKLIQKCEYRNGEPWDGVCQLYDMKAWIGEFKQGRPWNGYLETPGTDESNFYQDGVIVTREEYCKALGIDGAKRVWFVGLHYAQSDDDSD